MFILLLVFLVLLRRSKTREDYLRRKAKSRLRREEVFDRHHLEMLQEIYWRLVGEEAPEEIVDERWTRVGYQGRDPRTDLRAMGVLSIYHLHEYSQRDEASVVFTRLKPLPFACVGIQITAWIEEECLEDGHYHARMMSLLADSWSESDSVMQFPPLWERLKIALR